VLYTPRQLSAGRIDILAPRAPGDGRVTLGLQNVAEAVDSLLWRALESRLGKRIERYQVDLRGNVPQQARKLMGVSVRIVDAIQHHILPGDMHLMRLSRDIVAACIEQYLDRIFLVDGYQLIAQCIVRCMQ